MAYNTEVIPTYDFGTIRIGELVSFAETTSHINNGLYPQTTFVPTIIYYDDILPHLADVTAEAWSQWEVFTNRYYNSMSDVITALQSDSFHKIVTDIYWIWGAPDVGGFGVCRTGADSYSVVYINGYGVDGDYIRPLANSMTIANVHGYTVNNTPPSGYSEADFAMPYSGTYKTGISFMTSGTYDVNRNIILWNDPVLRFSTMSIFPATSSYLKPIAGTNLFDTITAHYTDVGENINTSWRFNFYNSLPFETINGSVVDPLWIANKNKQYSIDQFFPYFGAISLDVANVEGTSIFEGMSVVLDNTGNPYDVYDPNAGRGGGGGYQSRYSEDTLPEGVPALNLLNSGFVKLYNPTLSEVQQFASFLFSGITEDMSAVIKRMMVNPIDYILALNMIHIPLLTSNKEEIGFCGIGSEVEADVVTEQYYQIEYQIAVEEFWRSALDYSSYTKCKVYVPYCGIYEISIDEIQSGTLWLRFVIDVVSGSVVAFLGTKRVQKDGTTLRATLYQYNGNCILSMPVSQTNWQNTFSSVLNIANMAIAPSPTSVAGMAQDIMSQKVSVQKSGSISANFGYLGKQTPYIILERPELSIPLNYGKHEGYPSNYKRTLSEVSGYTEIKENTLIADGFTGTSEELDILKQELERGVYL